MKKNIFYFLQLLFFIVNIYSIDLMNYDFFGFKLNYSLDDLKKALVNLNKNDYIIYQDSHYDYPKLTYTIVNPKNQSLEEMMNLDYIITFYKDKIWKITKMKVDYSYIKTIEKDFGKMAKKEKNNSYETFYWYIGDIEIFVNKEIDDKKYIDVSIINNNVKKNVYRVDVDNLRLREEGNVNSKIIMKLEKDEIVEVVEKGKQDEINGIKGRWVKVVIEGKEKIFGWCFDAYLKKVD